MPQRIKADQVAATARDLDQAEFTRDDLAKKLGVKKPELRNAFRQARKSGRLEKVREDAEGTGYFRATGN
jgi:DNA-binding transcriptional regulator LsrR (DeoR family)